MQSYDITLPADTAVHNLAALLQVANQAKTGAEKLTNVNDLMTDYSEMIFTGDAGLGAAFIYFGDSGVASTNYAWDLAVSQIYIKRRSPNATRIFANTIWVRGSANSLRFHLDATV